MHTLAILTSFLVLSGTSTPDVDCFQDRLNIITSTQTIILHTEIQDTPERRAIGMMFRTEMAPHEAMLFAFPHTQEVAFWMENTRIPLDMIFVSETGTVVGIHENAQPMDRTLIPSPGPVRHVIEIPGGQARQLGLDIGHQIEHPFVQHPDLCKPR